MCQDLSEAEPGSVAVIGPSEDDYRAAEDLIARIEDMRAAMVFSPTGEETLPGVEAMMMPVSISELTEKISSM